MKEDQLKQTKKIIFYKVNPEVFKKIPFKCLIKKIEVEIYDTELKHEDQRYLMQFDLHITRHI